MKSGSQVRQLNFKMNSLKMNSALGVLQTASHWETLTFPLGYIFCVLAVISRGSFSNFLRIFFESLQSLRIFCFFWLPTWKSQRALRSNLLNFRFWSSDFANELVRFTLNLQFQLIAGSLNEINRLTFKLFRSNAFLVIRMLSLSNAFECLRLF